MERIAIVGMGMIGASFACAYKEVRPDSLVLGVDPSRESLAVARERGWIDEGAAPGDGAFERFLGEGCELVVLALPVDQARPYLEAVGRSGFAGLVTDTASTKGRICAMAEEVLPDAGIFLPGHPMAGSEVNGIAGARPQLFQGAHWILCPDDRTPTEPYLRYHDLLTGIGARVLSLPREQHDAAVAVISHVPHIVASSLVQLANQHVDDQGNLFRLAAGGFKDSTRIAAGSARLWSGILLDNAEEVSGCLRELRGIIESYRLAIAAGNRPLLEQLLEQSAEARRAIPTRWLPASEDLFEARIPMRNRQGAIAEITTCAGAHGCNIQSIEIDHLTAHTAVLSLVLTDEGDMDAFAHDLRESGYAVGIGPLTAKEHSHV